MRPNNSFSVHSALLRRPSSLLIHCSAPPPSACLAAQKCQQLSTTCRRAMNDWSSNSRAPNNVLKLSQRNKPSIRLASTISSNPPPPSTADRARKGAQVYTPQDPNSPKRGTTEKASTPDPTSSYAAPMNGSPHPSASASDSLIAPPLTWNAFLALRKTRRRYNLLSSVSTSLLTTSAGISLIAKQNIENAGIFGLDPFIVLGLATAGSGAVGWLMGPFVGNAVFGWVYRGRREEIAAKERDLYRRIKLHRVDPSSSSAGNPVPDYYGEKIGSVAEYRTWMKDQRAYNKRRQNFL